MRKLKTAVSLCAVFLLAVSTMAFAGQIDIETRCDCNYIKLYDSKVNNDVPNQPCDVNLTCDPILGQTMTLDATAQGTQLNLALLKACNWDESVSITLDVEFDAQFQPISIKVTDVDFDANSNPVH